MRYSNNHMNLQIPEIDIFGQGLIQHHFFTIYVHLIWSAKFSNIFYFYNSYFIFFSIINIENMLSTSFAEFSASYKLSHRYFTYYHYYPLYTCLSLDLDFSIVFDSPPINYIFKHQCNALLCK